MILLMKFVILSLILKTNLSFTQKYARRIKFIHVDHIFECVKVLYPLVNNAKCNFPRPLSNVTYHNPTSLRYVYKAVTEENRWIVPFHVPTLLAWDAHCIFNMLLGDMEVIYLITGETICNSSATVKFLPAAPIKDHIARFTAIA